MKLYIIISTGYSTHSLSVLQLPQFTVPGYLTELNVYQPTRQLRSSSDTSILCFPSVRTHSLGQRSCSYAALSVLNSLPCKIRSSNTLISFKSSLKSYIHLQAILSAIAVCVCVEGGVVRAREREREREFVLTVLCDCVMVLCLVISYVLQFGKMAHTRVIISSPVFLSFLFSVSGILQRRTKNPKLIHWNGSSKPWKSPTTFYKEWVSYRVPNPSPRFNGSALMRQNTTRTARN